jgi:hypothetical protein
VKWEPSVANFKQKNLARLTIHGFESDDNFTRYIRCVMKVAVNIQEISLHEKKVCKQCNNKPSQSEVCQPSRYPQTNEEKDFFSNKITEALVTASPSVIQFRPSCYFSPLDIEYYMDP